MLTLGSTAREWHECGQLAFFGIGVDVFSTHPEDARDVAFFFREHRDPRPEPGAGTRAQAFLACEGRGFFDSLLAKSGEPKRIALADRALGFEWQREFRSWSGAPSALPPFAHPHFQRRFSTFPGLCVESPEGERLLVLGPNYVGKTSLGLRLAAAGFRLVSDHLTVIDRDRRVAVPYRSPVGLRRGTLARLADAVAGLDHRRTVSESTGPVVLVHAADLYPGCEGDGGEVHRVFGLLPDLDAESVQPLAASGLRTFPGRAREELLRALPGEITWTSPAALAARLGLGSEQEEGDVR